jgi:threonyl-tRNA synthetase
MADAVKDAVNSAVDGVKNMAVAAEQKVDEKTAQKENKAPKAKKEKKPKGDGGDGRPLMLDPAPEFIDHRIQIL